MNLDYRIDCGHESACSMGLSLGAKVFPAIPMFPNEINVLQGFCGEVIVERDFAQVREGCLPPVGVRPR
jgi:hypothetical protein